MRYHALASDYDGTLAEHGKVSPKTLAALQRARDSGRKLVLVTGREWPDLRATFPEYKLFHQIVAENGALLIDPENGEETVIATPPPDAFIQRLRERGVQPLSVGRVIVATWQPHETSVLEAIRDLGLELQVIFNKGAVMVLPSGVNKASGLRHALERLRVSPHNCIAVGDAENDHALLERCELGVAVANSVPLLKERADWVTDGARGDGVVELIDEWLTSDLYGRQPDRHGVMLGTRPDGSSYMIPAHGSKLLVCGSSGSGKSTFTGALLEELADDEYQYCVIDPEGDFQTSPGHVVMGDAEHAPDPAEVVKALTLTPMNIVVNLLGVPLEQRPAFAKVLLEKLKAEQAQSGRPHWVVIDEAHHMLDVSADVSPEELHDVTSSLLLVTVHPERLHDKELGLIDTFVIVGSSPRDTLQAIARAHHVSIPLAPIGDVPLAAGSALVWSRRNPHELVTLSSVEPRQERRRHRRKYAVGELGPDKSFYFRGPQGALNLRAHNLALFLQVADGVDPDTWSYHLQRHDYSRWLREAVKDHDLADEVGSIERANASPSESRARVRRAIDRRYTLPA